MNTTSIKRGNSKLSKTCGIFDLPTSVCFNACPDCYAKKAERQYPNVIAYRNRNLENYKKSPEHWMIMISREIASIQHKINSFRIHSSGDFFSQEYINHWSAIVQAFPDIFFYADTKNASILDFTPLTSLKNFNLINSITPLGVNYGNHEHIKNLENLGYTVCPDTIKDNPKGYCMSECKICLSEQKVCFLKH